MTLPVAEVFLVASGDLRSAANQQGWPAQAEMERLLSAAVEAAGVKVTRAHPLDEQEGHGVSNTTIAIAWLLRHPAKLQPITGTMNVERLKDCCKASEVNLSREEWYGIYQAAGNVLP